MIGTSQRAGVTRNSEGLDLDRFRSNLGGVAAVNYDISRLLHVHTGVVDEF